PMPSGDTRLCRRAGVGGDGCCSYPRCQIASRRVAHQHLEQYKNISYPSRMDRASRTSGPPNGYDWPAAAGSGGCTVLAEVRRMTKAINERDRFRGCLLGLAVGDALGTT